MQAGLMPHLKKPKPCFAKRDTLFLAEITKPITNLPLRGNE